MYIVLAIIAFGVLIITHELGHFLAARACGVKVIEFSVGMGPLLLKKQGKETQYSLRLLPFGGFCAMEGEDEDTGDPRAFTAQKPWKRMIILAAGAAANFVIGFLLVVIVFAQASYSTANITDFMDGCPYEGENALIAGDSIYKIDGHRIYFSANVSDYMSRSGSDYHDIVVIRDGKKVELDDFYMALREYPQSDGSTLTKYGLIFESAEPTVGNCVKYSWYCSIDFVRLVWRGLGDLVTGTVGFKDYFSGPVGIVSLVNDTAKEETTTAYALMEVCYIFALIAINLAVMNMLPLPALDGGHIFLLIVTWAIEKLTRKKVDPKYEGYIHTAGFVLLMGLMVVVMFSDILKIIR